MKDLYLHILVEPEASEAELAAAIDAAAEADACRAILLHPLRRAIYNRSYSTLKTIGELRHRLNLDTPDSWFQQNCPDFVHRFKSASSPQTPTKAVFETTQPDQKTVTSPPAAQPGKPFPLKNLMWVLLSLTGLILAFLAYQYF